MFGTIRTASSQKIDTVKRTQETIILVVSGVDKLDDAVNSDADTLLVLDLVLAVLVIDSLMST